VLLQADVTANNAQDQALLQHLQVLGLPTIVFFDAQGHEQPAQRVTGFMDAPAFTTHLRNHTVNNTWLGTQASDNGGTYRAT
jgi:thiol:disulfide interchange protein DsbD